MTVEQSKPLIVTIDDISDFYTEKQIIDTCPHCGKDMWAPLTANGEPEIQYISPQFVSQERGATGKAPKIIPLVCINCGNVRLQHIGPIVDWMHANGRA